jgi:hypothetical protein
MAIIFSLPWALLMWSYVVPNSEDVIFSSHSRHQPSPPRVMNRMVIFFIALLLFCFTISNMPTRIIVCVSSVMMSPLVAGCISTSWRSSDDGELWEDNLTALKRLLGPFAHLKQLLSSPLASPFAQPTPDDVRSMHSMTEHRDRIAV